MKGIRERLSFLSMTKGKAVTGNETKGGKSMKDRRNTT